VICSPTDKTQATNYRQTHNAQVDKAKNVSQFLSSYEITLLISIKFLEKTVTKIIVPSPLRSTADYKGDSLHTLQMEHYNKTKHAESKLVIKAMK
jgi:hypothetical protein